MSDEQLSTEIVKAGSEIVYAGDVDLEDELDAEKVVWRSVIRAGIIAAPICVVIWMGIVVAAVGSKDPEDWLAWLGIGAIVGVLAGAFFGGWAAFLAKSHLLDEVDARSAARSH